MVDLVLLGATGFVGSAVLRASAARRIHVLVRGKGRLPDSQSRESLRILEGDVRDIPKELFPSKPHVVIHLATKQIDDGSGFEDVNVEGTRRVMANCNKETRGILYGSSVSVYGQETQIDVRESADTRPGTPLARTRATAEQIVFETAAKSGIPACSLRPRFIFGQGDRHTMPGLVRLVRQGILLGSGNQQYSIIDVDDYARVMLALADKMFEGGAAGQTALNLAYARPVSLNEITSVICTEFGLASPWIRIPVQEWMPRKLRSMPFSWAQTLATRLELFGFSHTFSIDKLRSLVGNAIPEIDPIVSLRSAATHHRPRWRGSIEAETRCCS